MKLTPVQMADFERDGYVFVRELFTKDEVDLTLQIAKCDKAINRAHIIRDASGAESKLWLTTELKTDIYNAFVRSPRIVEPTRQILNDDVYLWHYKMMMKEPKVGGAWEWHQDYGYWYGDGCLFPNLLSCMVGVNRANKENGCLQVLRGSHKLNRLNHGGVGQQSGADMERVNAAMKVLDLVHVELEPGDALFFHSNLLHASAQNHSDHPRWSFICCYNAMGDIPFRGGHGAPIKLDTWPNDSVLSVGKAQLARIEEAALANK